jgi:hypothetical protein
MRRRPHRSPVSPVLAVALAAMVAVLAACSPGSGATPVPTAPAGASGSPAASGPSVIPVIIGSHEAGPARFVFSFLDASSNLPAATPDRSATVAFIAPGATDPGAAVPSEFVWAIEGERGEYISHTEFPVAGEWKAVFTTSAPDAAEESIGVTFDVQEELPTIDVGAPAPASDTPTAADVDGDLSKISTDKDPDPAFYELSVADAVAQHTPFILVFATPAFCQSAQCGPTLDRVKALASKAPDDIAFINVEPYQLQVTDGRLQPVLDANDQLQAVPAVNEWGLLSEPWIFAVDGTGVVRGSYEGLATDGELEAAFKAISGT